MRGASPFHFIAPQYTHTFVIEPIQHGSGEETGRLYMVEIIALMTRITRMVGKDDTSSSFLEQQQLY